MHKLLIKNGYEDIEASWHQDFSIKMLVRERVDILILTEQNIAPSFEKLGFSEDLIEKMLLVEKGESCMAFSMDTPDSIVEKTRAAYQELLQEGLIPDY